MARGKQLSDADKAKRNKDRADNFKKVGSKRLNNALTAIGRLVPLSNKNAYVYTEDQISKIAAALNDAVKRVASAFAGNSVSSGGIEL